jgi:hypothetical protein
LASDLVVGAVRDSDGYPVAGATITLHALGSPATASTGRTAEDGTFAIDADAGATAVDVRCDYCLSGSTTRIADKPVTVIVRRFAMLRDQGISAADLRVLPYDTIGGIAGLLPFTVANRGNVSDRGLAGSRGTVVADGIPFYRATDGLDLGAAVPPHGMSTIAETDPTHANGYDARSSGGLFSVDTLDLAGGIARIDSNGGISGTLRGGNVLRGSFATAGGEYPSTRIVGNASFTIGTGALDVRAVAASGLGANADGATATFAQPIRNSSLTASLMMNRSTDPFAPENDTIASVSLQHAGITYGLRGMRAASSIDFDTSVQYDERAYIEAVHDNGHTRLFASLAAAQTGDGIAALANTSASAVLPIVSISTRIGKNVSVHADSVDALLAAPLYVLYGQPYGTSVERSHLLDAGIGFDDLHRLRIDVMAFRENSSGASHERMGGSGISAIWQIAPSLALRTWVMISRENAIGAPIYAPGAAGGVYPTSANLFDRNVIWVTAGNVLRVDAISHGGRLEGDISLPAGPQVRFIAGTRRDGLNRIVTLGLQLP